MALAFAGTRRAIFVLGMRANLFARYVLQPIFANHYRRRRRARFGRRATLRRHTVAASSILVERLTGLGGLLTVGAIGVALWGAGSSSLGATVLPRIFAVLGMVALAFVALRLTAYRLENAVSAAEKGGQSRAQMGRIAPRN